MHKMNLIQIEEFLRSPRHAVLGTTNVDGAPQLSSVWYLYEDGLFYVSASVNTVKVHNLRRDPRASICIDGCYPDYRNVVAYGEARLLSTENPFAVDIWRRIVRHYHESDEEALRYEKSIKQQPSTIIVIKPHRIFGQDYN